MRNNLDLDRNRSLQWRRRTWNLLPENKALIIYPNAIGDVNYTSPIPFVPLSLVLPARIHMMFIDLGRVRYGTYAELVQDLEGSDLVHFLPPDTPIVMPGVPLRVRIFNPGDQVMRLNVIAIDAMECIHP